MEDILSVGLVGCGQISGAHCSGFEKASNINLAMVMDTDEVEAYCTNNREVWTLVITNARTCRIFNQEFFY